MSAQQVATIVYTLVATTNVTAKRAVSRTAGQAADGGGAGVPIVGFADHKALLGEAFRVVYGPTAMAEAGAAIDGTVPTLKTDAQGRLIPTTAGTDVVAAILKSGQTASAAGEIVEVTPVVK